MASNFVFDTNIFIYYLNANPNVEIYFDKDFLTKNNIYYSVITEIELLSFPKLEDEEIEGIRSLPNRFLKLTLTEDIKEKTIEIKKKYKVGLGDSVIAASTLVYNAGLITRNEEDFAKITELTFTNPFK